MKLETKLIRLAYDNKQVRPYLLPLIKEAREKQALKIQQFQKMISLSGTTFGVLSAYGVGSKSENQNRHAKLVMGLQKRGYRSIVQLKGKWEGVSEKSVIVPGMKFQDLLELGREFQQISVIYKSGDGVIGMYYLQKSPPYAEAAVKSEGEPSFEVSPDKSHWSKGRGISFTFGFLWGQHIPWDGKTPLRKSQLEDLY